MMLFSAEAILASSTSKFGIEIPLFDDEDLKSSTESTISTSLRLCSSGSSPALTVRFLRRTRGRTPFHPCAVLPRPATRTHPLPATPFQCPRSRTATLGWGAAAHFPPLRWPDCALSCLRADVYNWPVTPSIATPEPSSRTIPTPDRTLVARWSLECVATLGS